MLLLGNTVSLVLTESKLGKESFKELFRAEIFFQ